MFMSADRGPLVRERLGRKPQSRGALVCVWLSLDHSDHGLGLSTLGLFLFKTGTPGRN